ncbi:MAG: PKD domain-containing protein [Acidimicrobiia bacterium]
MARARTLGIRIVVTAALAVGLLPVVAAAPGGALPNTTTPTLSLNRLIHTTPFVNTNQLMRDNEGSAFVPNDPAHPNIGGTDSLWLVEDNGRAAWEVDPYTGALKSSIHDATWQATKQYNASTDSGTGATAGTNRDPDIESAAYDSATDTMYVFSGKCCKTGVLPTVFRLKRGTDHTFHPESYQPLASGSDFTASDWNPQDAKVYVGVGSNIRTYDYETNVAGPTFSISSVSSIYGMSFSANGSELYVAGKVRLYRVDWNAKKLMTGWSIDLSPFGMKDSRSVALINDQFYIGDGYDGRSTSDPLRYAVFVFDACCGSGPPPVASFTTSQLGSPANTIQFTDTSTNSPTAWSWDFDNNGTTDSTAQNPQHTFPAPGDYPVKHTAANSGGTSQPVTVTVHVDPPGPPTAAFSYAAAASPPHTINFTDTSSGGPTSWAWDFDNDGTTDSTAQNPSHTFPASGSFPVKLTVSNAGGPSSVTNTVAVADPPPPTANFGFAAAASPPLTINFTDTSSGGPTSWAWDFDNDGTTDSTVQNPSHTFPAASTYSVKLTVDNGFGPSSITKSVTVSDQPVITTLNPVADSYVSWSSPTKNYATYTDLKVLANNGSYEYHPYFQFNVSGLAGAPTSAKLRLYVTDGGPSGGNWFSPLGSWTETGINWNNAPPLTGTPFASVGTTTAGQWIEIDVTAQVTGNGAFTFAATSPSTNTVTFASRESAFAPQLVITH